ncbi:CYFA0S01e03224g1_1 [Cyberlindnera fabianii]|uniref:CYFA0S01e03224g1_1 n=1 Tax=Cyberlindnera fabianii TaxID=36022 RepID=A0A061AMR6_CYBFA|nr:CYFA0S01e03224g1_1 [Cyberlindnera fabianii]
MKLSIPLLSLFSIVYSLTYIVEYTNINTTDPQLHQAHNSTTTLQRVSQNITHTIDIGKFQCFLIEDLTEADIVMLEKTPGVISIKKDERIFLASNDSQLAIEEVLVTSLDPQYQRSPDNRKVKVQENAPGHLTRLSTRRRTNQIEENVFYYDSTGKDIFVYVLDTGIFIEHPEFDGRALRGASFVEEKEGDSHGHGTHVAGLIGSKTFGVAKEVTLVDVKVVNSKGLSSISKLLLAIEWCVNDIKTRSSSSSSPPAIINISLATVSSDPESIKTLSKAVEELISLGIVVITSLGNFLSSINTVSPANALGVIVAGASMNNTIANFSNYALGDIKFFIFAPGVNVVSLSHKDIDQVAVLNGSSSSALLTSGCAAGYLEKGTPLQDIGQVLVAKSTKKILDTYDNQALYRYQLTPNRLLYCSPLVRL